MKFASESAKGCQQIVQMTLISFNNYEMKLSLLKFFPPRISETVGSGQNIMRYLVFIQNLLQPIKAQNECLPDILDWIEMKERDEDQWLRAALI